MIVDANKSAFRAMWSDDGYRENFDVFGPKGGATEAEVVAAGIAPFCPGDVALEIGCGGGFWTDRHLASNFGQVVALDVLPAPRAFASPNVHYIEVADRDFDCLAIATDAFDFVWSFGVFCHLTLAAQAKYVRAVHRVLKPGGHASLYFSNAVRRPGCASPYNTESEVPWVANDPADTVRILMDAGFRHPRDLLPTMADSLIGVTK